MRYRLPHYTDSAHFLCFHQTVFEIRCPYIFYLHECHHLFCHQMQGFLSLKEAIDLTVRECIEENILRDFLEQHRREVCDMCLTEFDEKKYEDVLREEGFPSFSF